MKHYEIKCDLESKIEEKEVSLFMIKFQKIFLFSIIVLSIIVASALMFFLTLIKTSFLISLIPAVFLFLTSIFITSRKVKTFEENFTGKLSIIIPAKNEEVVIEKTITNIEDQKYDNFEIIVIDDCSTDKTGQIADRLSKKYKNIKVLHISLDNQIHGKAAGLNRVMDLVDGDFVLIIDADVILETNYLENILKPFVNKNIGYVQTGIRTYSKGTFVSFLYDADFAITNIFMAYFLKPRSFGRGIVLRTAVFKKVLPLDESSICDDIQMSLKLNKLKIKGTYRPDITCYEEAPQTLKTVWLQRKRWFLGDFIERIKVNKLMFVFSSFMLFIFDLWIITFFLAPFSLLGMLFLSLLLSLLGIVSFNAKKFKIKNVFFTWLGAIISYLINLASLNLFVFISVFQFDRRISWYKTPRKV